MALSVFAEDGDILWTFTPVGRLTSYPAIDTDGTIYVGVTKQIGILRYEYYLYAINSDGTQKWVSPSMPGNGSESLTIPQPAIGDDGIIYIGTPGSKLYAYNTDGSLKWEYDFRADTNYTVWVRYALAIANDGTIYAGVGPNRLYLYAINPNGTKKWSHYIGYRWGGEMGSSVIAADGTVYVVSHLGSIHAFEPDGIHRSSASPGIHRNIAIGDNETIYITNGYCSLIALNSKFVTKWIFEISSNTLCTTNINPIPIISTDGTVSVYLDEVYAIDSNGIEKWSQLIGNHGHILGADGNIYTGNSIISPNGAIIGTLPTFVDSPALGVDGILYGTSTSGLCAIETSSNGPAASAWPMFQNNLRRNGRMKVVSTPPSSITFIQLLLY